MSPDDAEDPIDDLKLARIDTALHSYAWSRIAWSERRVDGHAHCAVGMLLRHAGVDPEALIRIGMDVWERFGPLLRREYGLPGPKAVDHLVAVNSRYDTREEMAVAALKVLMGDESVLPDPGGGLPGAWEGWLEAMAGDGTGDAGSTTPGPRVEADPDAAGGDRVDASPA